MSDFASMLASFKSKAVATPESASSASSKPPAFQQGSASANTANQQPRSMTRKRPHPDPEDDANNIVVGRNNSGPSFPSMHASEKNRQTKFGTFQLSFLVIGAQKAGTSWLHALLQKCSHSTRISLPIRQKEVHFWDWHYRKGFQWYIRQFEFPHMNNLSAATNRDTGEQTSLATIKSNKKNDALYGEITPCYIVLPPSTVHEIFQCFPKLKLIFIARDMVDRVWSAMIMELRDRTMGRNPGEFADGAVPEDVKKSTNNPIMMVSAATQRRLHQQSLPSSQSDAYFLERLRSETHTSRSDYASHLRKWYRYFPAKNILIIDYREIEKNPRGVLIAVLIHIIGVDEDEARAQVGKLHDEEVGQRVNVAITSSTGVEQTSSSSSSSQELLSQRPNLKIKIQEYLRPFAVNFNLMLKEQGYTWRLDE